MRTEALAAWAECLRAVEQPKLNATNPHFGNRYADLAEVKRVTDAACAAHGFLVQHSGAALTADGQPPVPGIRSKVLHLASGETVAESFFRVTADDPQKQGGAWTYGRRYNLAALFGLVAEDDDDGNAASSPAPARQQAPRPQARPTPPAAPRPQQRASSAPSGAKDSGWHRRCIAALADAVDGRPGQRNKLAFKGKYSVRGKPAANLGLAPGNYTLDEIERAGGLEAVHSFYRWLAAQNGVDGDAVEAGLRQVESQVEQAYDAMGSPEDDAAFPGDDDLPF